MMFLFVCFFVETQTYYVTMAGLGTHRDSPSSASRGLEGKMCTTMPDSVQCFSYYGFIKVHVIWQKISSVVLQNFLGYFWISVFLYKFKNQLVSLNEEILLGFCWTLIYIYGRIWRELSWFRSNFTSFLCYLAIQICLHIIFCPFKT